MHTENVKIVEVNEENWYACCELTVSEEQQGFVEPNAVSIAQSKFEPSLQPYAIYAGDTVAGFLMFNTVKEELDAYWIYRIMVDAKHQGKGIAKAATRLALAEMNRTLQAEKVVVGYHPDNLAAHKLYASLGFVDQGNRFGKEMAVVKTMTSS
ncbi:GNAT family N-acetyltransferase [Planococcus sp. N028]|uniref:GNAT family N-acetyltransferase n=1 Tax=Planococcus shixiaomingii TaxID=3058393 RepID=A0ABT8N2W1_9BACL|nr:GNAT family N-acetyltransferase [Planococcus sp. N028]MDN7242232.1 GNAT family N-acetyltransferase [Planococcus sp. N028]